MTHDVWLRRRAALVALLCLIAGWTASGPGAIALEEQKGEEAAIQECDKRLCAILMEKNPQGPDLKCLLTKTWARSKIKEADSNKLSWGFGDARCSVAIELSRERLVAAMTEDRVTVHIPRHTAKCVVEDGGKLEKVTAVLAPKIEFRQGRADKIWVRLKSVDGPTSVTSTVQAAAQLADTFGLFHRQMIRGINRYIERHCPTTTQTAAAKAPTAAAKEAKDAKGSKETAVAKDGASK